MSVKQSERNSYVSVWRDYLNKFQLFWRDSTDGFGPDFVDGKINLPAREIVRAPAARRREFHFHKNMFTAGGRGLVSPPRHEKN